MPPDNFGFPVTAVAQRRAAAVRVGSAKLSEPRLTVPTMTTDEREPS